MYPGGSIKFAVLEDLRGLQLIVDTKVQIYAMALHSEASSLHDLGALLLLGQLLWCVRVVFYSMTQLCMLDCLVVKVLHVGHHPAVAGVNHAADCSASNLLSRVVGVACSDVCTQLTACVLTSLPLLTADTAQVMACEGFLLSHVYITPWSPPSRVEHSCSSYFGMLRTERADHAHH